MSEEQYNELLKAYTKEALASIREILILRLARLQAFLGGGSQFGVRFEYAEMNHGYWFIYL